MSRKKKFQAEKKTKKDPIPELFSEFQIDIFEHKLNNIFEKENHPVFRVIRKIMEETNKRINYNKSAQKISTILFDVDNTLIQTRKADSKACNKVKIKWF